MTDFPFLFFKKKLRLSQITSFLCVFICARLRLALERRSYCGQVSNLPYDYGIFELLIIMIHMLISLDSRVFRIYNF